MNENSNQPSSELKKYIPVPPTLARVHSGLSLLIVGELLLPMMKTVGTIAAIAVGANALVARDATCCFGLTASGGASGTIGQLGDGQNRIGGGLPPAQFCIDSSGGIKDSSGRGCILTRKFAPLPNGRELS